ncbi:InlB B-repeat-containing protein [Candidatus Saccharibacteria bacterium]|nr:InlB B-repeat-containing protein [Candidatus Saccharibacteria bacterium]
MLKKRFILGIIFAGVLALLGGGRVFAVSGNTATISGGKTWEICVSTGTDYKGSAFVANITKSGFESQVVFGDFEQQGCKNVKLAAGDYTVSLNKPMGAGETSYEIIGSNKLVFTIASVLNKYFNSYGSVNYETEGSGGTTFPTVFAIEGECTFHGNNSNITGSTCIDSDGYDWTDSKYIDTGVALFRKDDVIDNASKDFEVYFEIESYESSQEQQATYFNAKNEDASMYYPGFVIRIDGSTSSKIEITSRKGVNSSSDKKAFKYNITAGETVKVIRKDGIITYSLNGGEFKVLDDFSNFSAFFNQTAFFGASQNTDGTPMRIFKGTLRNMYIKLGKIEAPKHTVSFDANGGTGSMNPLVVNEDEATPITANSFTREGYVFNGWNTAANGSGTSFADGADITVSAAMGDTTLYAQWRLNGSNTLYHEIVSRQNNGVDSYIDFTTKATVATGNGNGLNIRSGTENDENPIYYFRGEVNDNNVIWADKCWKIVRTTSTGGTKMIYNGEPSDIVVDGEIIKQCNATYQNNQITVKVNGVDTNAFKFNNDTTSPADVGYMFGTRISSSRLSAGSTIFTFSNNVSRNGNSYDLDINTGQSISGTWANERANAAVRYHYFCTDGATSCDNTKIGYISYFGNSSIIYYLKVDGYDDIEDMKDAMFSNTTDSNAKAMIETWFEQQNLDGHIIDTKNYEDDLEDTIFCNDRSYYSGALKGKDSDATPSGGYSNYSYHGSIGRNFVKNSDNNYEPSLDCININDSFTKYVANGNGKLKYKIGLVTDDELTIAGMNRNQASLESYLYTGSSNVHAWTASPNIFSVDYSGEGNWDFRLSGNNITGSLGLRPLVSLKNSIEFTSGTGLSTDPYIVE